MKKLYLSKNTLSTKNEDFLKILTACFKCKIDRDQKKIFMKKIQLMKSMLIITKKLWWIFQSLSWLIDLKVLIVNYIKKLNLFKNTLSTENEDFRHQRFWCVIKIFTTCFKCKIVKTNPTYGVNLDNYKNLFTHLTKIGQF